MDLGTKLTAVIRIHQYLGTVLESIYIIHIHMNAGPARAHFNSARSLGEYRPLPRSQFFSGQTDARKMALQGCRIIELAGIGPGPHCCMMLADQGAEVIRQHFHPPGHPSPLQRRRRGQPLPSSSKYLVVLAEPTPCCWQRR
jgi:hypothetical protein